MRDILLNFVFSPYENIELKLRGTRVHPSVWRPLIISHYSRHLRIYPINHEVTLWACTVNNASLYDNFES